MFLFFFFSSRRRHTRFSRDWSSDVCSSDLVAYPETLARAVAAINGDSRVITGHTGIPDSYAGAGRRSAERTSPDPRRRYMTVDDLQEYADFNRDFLAAVRQAMQAGKSVEQAA